MKDGVTLENRDDHVFISFNDLPEAIHQLSDILHDHLETMVVPNESALAREMRKAASERNSWPTWKRKAMKS